VTVRDALGTLASSTRTLEVVLGPATSVVTVGPSAIGPIIVGTPEAVGWQALDVADLDVTDFAENATLTVQGSGGSPALFWANVSGSNSLSTGPEASLAIPASAWVDGRLNVTITPITAGLLSVALSGPGVLAAGPGYSVAAEPDLAHLKLFDPTVAAAGDHSNATFWHVSDRYGNAVVGATLVIQTTSGNASVDRSVPVVALANGGSGAWVNFTLSGPGSSVRVLDLAGNVLLGPIDWTATTTSTGPAYGDLLLLALVVGTIVGVAAAVASNEPRRRARARLARDEEAAMQQLAEGRAAVVEIVRQAGVAPWRLFEELWEPPPPPPDLYDWIASLVADGTLLERPSEGGGVEYTLAPSPPEPGAIVTDAEARDRAVARREAAVNGDDRTAP
jgi:hypothetical protein